MSTETTWAVSRDEEHYEGEYASPEEAAACAVDHYDVKPGDTVYVGRTVAFNWELSISADVLLERMSEHACDEVGEYAEDWLQKVPKEAEQELEARLRVVVREWMAQFGHTPRFFSIEDDRAMIVPPEAR